jgi:hypothetical protein
MDPATDPTCPCPGCCLERTSGIPELSPSSPDRPGRPLTERLAAFGWTWQAAGAEPEALDA